MDEEQKGFDYQDTKEPPSMTKRFVKELIDLIKIFVICMISVYLLTTFIAKPIRVDGSSMYPTLESEEVGITNVFAAKYMGISRFDVVIIHNDEADEYWVKRVIGLPNDTVEVKDEILYINGEAVEQPFLDTDYVKDIQKDTVFTNDFGPVVLAEDEYWMMGDNRYRSEDSRVHGPFKESEIVGKDVFILYPFNKIKMVRNTGE